MVGETHLDPGARVCAIADAQTVAIPNVTDGAGEALADAVRQASLAGIGPDRRGERQDSQGQSNRSGDPEGKGRDAGAARRSGETPPHGARHVPDTDTGDRG